MDYETYRDKRLGEDPELAQMYAEKKQRDHICKWCGLVIRDPAPVTERECHGCWELRWRVQHYPLRDVLRMLWHRWF